LQNFDATGAAMIQPLFFDAAGATINLSTALGSICNSSRLMVLQTQLFVVLVRRICWQTNAFSSRRLLVFCTGVDANVTTTG